MVSPDRPDREPPSRRDPLDPESDFFKPPAIPTLVHCIHCNNEYDSYLITWRVETDHEGKSEGCWCCPVPGCGGVGFLFDIFPVDPDWRDEHGNKVCFIDDEDDDENVDGFDEDGEFDDEPSLLEEFQKPAAPFENPPLPDVDKPRRRPPINEEDIPF